MGSLEVSSYNGFPSGAPIFAVLTKTEKLK